MSLIELATTASARITNRCEGLNFVVGDDPTVTMIQDQAKKPPGGEECIGSFYSAFSTYLASGHPCAIDLIAGVKNTRDLTPELHTNLLFRATQKAVMDDPQYPQEYRTYNDWMVHLERIFNSMSHFQEIKQILLEKETTTTVYQRYFGEFAIAEHLANGAEVNIIDLGSGGNYGVPGMQIGEPFKKIIDNTPNEFINSKLGKQLRVREGWAVDLNDPYDSDEIAWRHSCGLYPSELTNGGLEQLLALEARLSKANTRFHQENLLNIGSEIPRGYFDFAMINTMLYQLKPAEQAIVIANARELLTPEGWLFIQDFAIKDPADSSRLIFDGVKWGNKGSYKLFVTANGFGDEIFELLRWSNGRCKEADPGEDFKYIAHLLN